MKQVSNKAFREGAIKYTEVAHRTTGPDSDIPVVSIPTPQGYIGTSRFNGMGEERP
jgi:hypothetical protein